jgi:hypothetical protein
LHPTFFKVPTTTTRRRRRKQNEVSRMGALDTLKRIAAL